MLLGCALSLAFIASGRQAETRIYGTHTVATRCVGVQNAWSLRERSLAVAPHSVVVCPHARAPPGGRLACFRGQRTARAHHSRKARALLLHPPDPAGSPRKLMNECSRGNEFPRGQPGLESQSRVGSNTVWVDRKLSGVRESQLLRSRQSSDHLSDVRISAKV